MVPGSQVLGETAPSTPRWGEFGCLGEERGQGILSVPRGVEVQGPGRKAVSGRGEVGSGSGGSREPGDLSAGRVVGLAQAQQCPCLSFCVGSWPGAQSSPKPRHFPAGRRSRPLRFSLRLGSCQPRPLGPRGGPSKVVGGWWGREAGVWPKRAPGR